MEYRKHWLINAQGQRYDFTEKEIKTFLYEPQGFGFRRQYSTQIVGNSELVTSEQYILTDITGDLLFYGNGNGTKYQDYQNFIQFCKFTPLEFHYQTPNSLSSYHCDVIFTQADKTEISASDKILHVPVTFHRLTEWLTDQSIVTEMDNSPIGEGKFYDYEYDYSYAGSNLSNTSIYNNGTDEVGFVLTINGEVQNPQFTLSQGGEVYGICKINGTYDFVQIDSVERTESMYLELNGSSIANPEQFQDFTVADGQAYLTWIKLRVGESTFAFTCGNIDTFNGTVALSFKESYVSV